jgi:hypothetical protein
MSDRGQWAFDRLVVTPSRPSGIPQALLSFRFGSRERARDGARRARALAGFSGHGFKFGAVIGETRGGRRAAALVTAWAAGQG